MNAADIPIRFEGELDDVHRRWAFRVEGKYQAGETEQTRSSARTASIYQAGQFVANFQRRMMSDIAIVGRPERGERLVECEDQLAIEVAVRGSLGATRSDLVGSPLVVEVEPFVFDVHASTSTYATACRVDIRKLSAGNLADAIVLGEAVSVEQAVI